jgi:hypothetical protein
VVQVLLKDLQVTNGNTAGAAIRFISDASNTVTYVDVSGVNTTSGGLFSSQQNSTTGNDFNNVNNCNIKCGYQ